MGTVIYIEKISGAINCQHTTIYHSYQSHSHFHSLSPLTFNTKKMHSPNATTCNHHNPNANPIPLNFLPADYDICSNPNPSAHHPDSIINFPSSPHACFEFDHIYLQFLDPFHQHHFNYYPHPLPPSSDHDELIVTAKPPSNTMPLENSDSNANYTVIGSNNNGKVEYNLADKKTTKSKKFRRSKKDRHSKINTANGPRDRRMRLSLDVARRFFCLQDFLGFDKASRTVDWLLKNSDDAIRHLERSRPAADLQNAGVNNNSASSTSDERAAAASYDELPKGPSGIKAKNRGAARRSKSRKVAGRVRRATIGRESRREARERARERTSQKRRLMGDESYLTEHPKLPFADSSVMESANDDRSWNNHPSALLYGYLHFEHQNEEQILSFARNHEKHTSH